MDNGANTTPGPAQPEPEAPGAGPVGRAPERGPGRSGGAPAADFDSRDAATMDGVGLAGSAGYAARRTVLNAALHGMSSSGVSDSAGFFSWVLTTGEVVCDEQTLRLHGLPPDADPTFQDFLSRVPEEDLEGLLETLNPALDRVGDYLFEYRVAWPDGGIHTLEARARVIAGPEGRPQHMMGIIADITARRAAEQAAQSQAKAAARMQAVTGQLASASTMAEMVEAVRRSLDPLRADLVLVLDTERRPCETLLCCTAEGASPMSPLRLAEAPDGALAAAASEAQPLFLPDLEAVARRFPGSVEAVAAAGLQALVLLPLPLPGARRLRCVCVIGYTGPVRFDDRERAVLVLAASAVGQAVARAIAHDADRGIALALQDGMLPKGLKFGPGVHGVYRYGAATNGIQVGGDWYDSVAHQDGATTLIIGDVEGHNAYAAGMMYRLRISVRTLVRQGEPVEAVLRRANESMVELNEDTDQPLLATCLVVRVDPETRTLTAGRAGHLPPVISPPGRPAEVPEAEVGVPFGIMRDTGDYPVWQTKYEPGTILLLCTDGLLESRDNNVDNGRDRTLAVLGALKPGYGADPGELDRLAEMLLQANRPDGPWKDDVAFILALLD